MTALISPRKSTAHNGKNRGSGHKFRPTYNHNLNIANSRARELGASPRCDVVPHTLLVCQALVQVQPLQGQHSIGGSQSQQLLEDIQAAAKQRTRPVQMRVDGLGIKVTGIDSRPRLLVSLNGVPSILKTAEMEALLRTLQKGIPVYSGHHTPTLADLGILLEMPGEASKALIQALGK